MRAVVLEAFNPEERLRVASDWPRPRRRKGEVLVRVHATAVNRSVYKTANGFIPRLMATLPKVGAWVGGWVAGQAGRQLRGAPAGTDPTLAGVGMCRPRPLPLRRRDARRQRCQVLPPPCLASCACWGSERIRSRLARPAPRRSRRPPLATTGTRTHACAGAWR